MQAIALDEDPSLQGVLVELPRVTAQGTELRESPALGVRVLRDCRGNRPSPLAYALFFASVDGTYGEKMWRPKSLFSFFVLIVFTSTRTRHPAREFLHDG